MLAYRLAFMLTAPPCDSTDSDGDSDECDARSIVESGRPSMIQLIEYACPKELTTGRFSTFSDAMLFQTAGFPTGGQSGLVAPRSPLSLSLPNTKL